MKPLELITLAVQDIRGFMESRLKSKDMHLRKTATLMAYWIRDYVRLLNKERHSKTYRRYQRGSIVKVHLGYRIGSEEGGLHYGIVLDKRDTTKNNVITIVPMTSVKPTTDLEHLHVKDVYLGTEVTDTIINKIEHDAKTALVSLLVAQEEMYELQCRHELTEDDAKRLREKINHAIEKNRIAGEQVQQAAKMKRGGIALCNQIVTVSKLRIYDPCSSRDMLYGVKLHEETMAKIDAKIKEFYLDY